jgi:hypothetical protein
VTSGLSEWDTIMREVSMSASGSTPKSLIQLPGGSGNRSSSSSRSSSSAGGPPPWF